MKKILGLLIVFTLLTVKPVLAAGPLLKFVPSTGTYTNGETFKVNIGIDSGTEKSQSVDVVATYDPTKVEVVSIDALTNDSFQFIMEKNIYNDTGKFTAWFISVAPGTYEATVITGDLATVTFRPKTTGTINVNFSCTTGSTIDSNINNASALDVINCASNVNGVYTITAGGGGGSTPDPTATPVPANDDGGGDDTTLPQTGGVGTTIGLLVFGIVGILSSLALRWL